MAVEGFCMDDNTVLVPGDIVQIDPDHDEIFGGCLMMVTEPGSWGAQGYFNIPGKGLAYYRATWEVMEKVGHAEWQWEAKTDVPPVRR